jgi:hypothetical protein
MAIGLGSMAARADVVYVSARAYGSGCAASNATCPGKNTDSNGLGNPVYSEVSINLGDVGAKSSVTDVGVPERGGERGYLSGTTLTSTSAGIDVSPTLAVAGGVYLVEYTQNTAANNVSQDIVTSVSATGAAVSVASTTVFQRAGSSVWKTVGYITNDVSVTTPTLSFRYASGTVNATSGNRWVIDLFRFTLYNPCQNVTKPTVIGPVAAGQTLVGVTNINASATKITIYQDSGSGMVAVGSKTSGLVFGVNTNFITVTPLTKEGLVAATQTVNSQESCVPNTGLLVGGGANPRLRLVLSVRETTNTTTGPVGGDGRFQTTNALGRVHFIGASTVVSGVPQEGKVFNPSTNWQTVTFQRGVDPANPVDPTVLWSAGTGGGTIGTQNDLQGTWGTIDAIGLVSDDLTDNGPFELYIDNITNGTTAIETFEAGTNGQTGFTFWQPSFSGTTSANMAPTPDETAVVSTAADTGTKSLRTRFQFADHGANRWIRFTTSNTTSGHPNPMIKLDDPISFRILLLPVGSSPTPPAVGNPGKMTANRSGNVISLSWTNTAATLQQASTVGTNTVWTDVSGAASGSLSVTNPTGAKFYRLRQ